MSRTAVAPEALLRSELRHRLRREQRVIAADAVDLAGVEAHSVQNGRSIAAVGIRRARRRPRTGR